MKVKIDKKRLRVIVWPMLFSSIATIALYVLVPKFLAIGVVYWVVYIFLIGYTWGNLLGKLLWGVGLLGIPVLCYPLYHLIGLPGLPVVLLLSLILWYLILREKAKEEVDLSRLRL